MELDQWSRISKSIRFRIDVFDGKFDDDNDVNMEDSRPDTMKLGGSFKSGNIVLGAVQKRRLLKEIAVEHADDPAFTGFQHKFIRFIQEKFSSKFSKEDMDTILDPSGIVCIRNSITC
jgi:hypothetical protein